LPCPTRSLLFVHFQFFADHAAELHYYVQPLVVEEPPQQLSTGEYVAKLEAGDLGVPDVTRSLSEEAAAFLASTAPADRLLLLLGEAGSGKSMFTWLTARRLLDEYDACVAALLDAAVPAAGAGSRATAAGAAAAAPASVLWVPVVIDLKNYKVSKLQDLLPWYLLNKCDLSEAAIADLRRGVPLPGLPDVVPRLLLLCDGFDELQAEGDPGSTKIARGALENFAAVLCGSVDSAWSPAALKVVVTCRESRLAGRTDENKVFGKHRRRVLLPFNTKQVGSGRTASSLLFLVLFVGACLCAAFDIAVKVARRTVAPNVAGKLLRCWSLSLCYVLSCIMQIRTYLDHRMASSMGSSVSAVDDSGHAPDVPTLPPDEYLVVMRSSPSLVEMTRNPFVLRLFVDALPSMKAAGLDPA
jgi:hypothetical protein